MIHRGALRSGCAGTPLTLGLLPDRDHQIGLTKSGYDPVMQVLSVAADSQQELNINLVAQLGEVGINSEPTGAAVWVDGERQGNTPTRLMLMAISHQLEIGFPGFASQSAEVTPRPGFPQVLEFKLEELDITTGSGYPKVVETSLDQDLLLVLPGEFIMGSSRREQGRRSNEKNSAEGPAPGLLDCSRLSHSVYRNGTRMW